MTIQQQIELFAPPGFEDLLARESGDKLRVELKKRLRSRWYVKENRLTGKRTLYIPAAFEQAPAEVKRGLLEWARMPLRTRRNSINTRRRRELENQAFAFLHEKGVRPRSRRFDPRQLAENTRGTRYDLREVFDSVNKRFFDDTLQSALRWGGRATTTSYMSRKMDLEGKPFNLITIAGAYDHPDVPRFAIESIMHHEMLHIAEPPTRKNGRNSIHTAAFQARERAFPFYQEWIRWEKRTMPGLIRSLRRKKVRI